MLGIGALATVCEIAWQQGDDLYSALDNRLMKGFEYVAKYNLGYNVPFAVWKDVTGKYSNWTEISNKGRGRYMPIFEMTYNHFVIRKGMQMPYTEQVLRQIRPEGYDRDQPAFGSLLFNEAGTKKNYVDLVNPFVDSHRSRWFFSVRHVVRLVWSALALIRIPSTLGDQDICMTQNKYAVLVMFIIGRCPVWR